MRILLVEDEQKMANFIQRGLKEEGHAVDVAVDGESGWQYAETNDYDALILDIMLPKMSGLEVCKKVREANKQTPILILTARDTTQDKVTGLDHGADDYLTKPFHFDELLARLRALLRRPTQLQEQTQLKSDDLVIDLLTHRVSVNGNEIALSQKEFALLEFLMRKKGEVVSRTQIAEHVWDLHFDPMSNTIDVYINFLRKKLDNASQKKKRIETVRGAGYRLIDS